jgi:hypothetical protein
MCIPSLTILAGAIRVEKLIRAAYNQVTLVGPNGAVV